MSNRRKIRQFNGGRLTRPRALWTGKTRDTFATHEGKGTNADIRRGEWRRLQEAER